MSTVTDYSSVSTSSELAPYRAVSRAAVISLALAIVSLPLVTLALVSMRYQVGDAVPLGIVGAIFAGAALILGLVGNRAIRRYPTEYTGGRMASTGVIGGMLLLLVGVSIASFTYATEVPPDCIRTGFWELQPDPEHPELPVSPKSLELTGKKIFIKGYMHPGVASMGKVNHFILVPDMGTCCFGGQPKSTDMIEVHVPDDADRISYAPRRIKLAGTFLLADRPGQSLGLNGVWYHLEVDQVR
jgi:hypothetical protein